MGADSKPGFTGHRGRLLDAEKNDYADKATHSADVYVLDANLAGRQEFNHFDTSQWSFAVLSCAALEATGQA